MGKKFNSSMKEFSKDSYTYDKDLVQHFQENENKIKEDFKAKLRMMQKYYQELQETCHVKGQNNAEIKRK